MKHLIQYGKGQIVLFCLPQLVRSLQPRDFAISLVIAKRLLGNALRPMVRRLMKSERGLFMD